MAMDSYEKDDKNDNENDENETKMKMIKMMRIRGMMRNIMMIMSMDKWE